MLGTKLKLTDVRTGQEWFLLTTKMNLKGLLVQAAHTLEVGAQVHLSLQLEDGRKSLELEGEIYKIAERAGGQKGMIVRFLDPSQEAINRISGYLAKKGTPVLGESQEYAVASSTDKTTLARTEQDTLSILTFTQPRLSAKDSELISTVDEEEEQKKAPNFAEETHIVAPSDYDSFIRKVKRPSRVGRWYWLFLLILITGAFFLVRGLIERLPAKMPPKPNATPLAVTPSPEAPSPVETATPIPTPTPVPTPTPSPTTTPISTPSEIKHITVEDDPAFLKVSVEGTALGKPDVNRLSNPRRIVLGFPKARKASVESSISVGQNPLLRIRTVQQNTGFEVVLDLYPVEFPRYDVKELPNGFALYLYH